MKLKKSNKLNNFLSKLDNHNISYVSWKSNHELKSAMSGFGDIDLFVPLNSSSKFVDLCRSDGWIEVFNPIAVYPWIKHFYGLGDNSKVFHIHVYFKLITGDSWIKEYCLPFEKWIIENREWSSNYDIWVMNNISQAYLFLIRHLIKNGTFVGRLLYMRNFTTYHEEWKHCCNNVRLKDVQGPIDVGKYLEGSGVFEDNFELPKISLAKKFRLACYPFLRFKNFSLPLLHAHSFILRLFNKFFLKQKKLFPKKGITIAISGVDGSGKTTMIEEVDKVFGEFLTINRFHLGRPQGRLIEFIWKTLGNKSKNSIMPGTSNITVPSSKGRAINGAILAFLRFLKARLIIKRSKLGGLMLVDRWPTNEIGKMDGPRVILSENSGWVEHLCKKTEMWFYNNIPKADICYFFKVPMEVAIERNRLRTKKNKETHEQILARFQGNLDFKPLAKKTIYFENSGELSTKRKEFLEIMWNDISNQY
jgi:hypothetical protein